MFLSPCFYFRPISNSITLSHFFNIQLRNPNEEELPLFQHNLRLLSQRLSDKERRRILYTLYPLGNIDSPGTLEEQFIYELSKIWVIASCDNNLPFDEGLVDYGFLCGYIVDGVSQRNPSGFICDVQKLSSRELLRALKIELPKAAKSIIEKNYIDEDIQQLIKQGAYWDGIFATHYVHCVQLAKSLRLAQQAPTYIQKLLQYCVSAEILLVHNPSKGDSKMPMNRQFASKLALIRHLMIKLKQQHHIQSPEDTQQIFNQIYDLRSQIIHGRDYHKTSPKIIAQYLNILYPTIRLAMELQQTDPLFIDFIKKI